MAIYFNPETRSAPTEPVLTGVWEVPDTDAFYKFYVQEAYSSRELAIKEDVTGMVYFFEDGRLFQASSTGSWEFQPLQEEPTFVPGINWSRAFFLHQDVAQRWAGECGCRHRGVDYSAEYDTYEVNYHHDVPVMKRSQNSVSKLNKMNLTSK